MYFCSKVYVFLFGSVVESKLPGNLLNKNWTDKNLCHEPGLNG